MSARGKQPQVGRITTTNLVEVAYLLDRRHEVVAVSVEPVPPYGIDELCITMEGTDISLDHRLYLHGHSYLGPVHVRRAFSVVVDQIDLQVEHAALEARL